MSTDGGARYVASRLMWKSENILTVLCLRMLSRGPNGCGGAGDGCDDGCGDVGITTPPTTPPMSPMSDAALVAVDVMY